MRYLLDMNILSDLVRQPRGAVAQRIAAIGETDVCTSIVVAAELRYGAARRNSPRLTAQVEAILSRLDVLPFEAPADVTYGALRATLERAGTPVGANDLLIAAQALTLGHTLVTDNEREFSRIDGLRRENWLRPA